MKIKIAQLVLIIFALSRMAQAVNPAPDGGYPGGNTAEGQNALLGLTTGTYNTAVGIFSLLSDTEGTFNTALGAGALLANVGSPSTGEGMENTATGAGALLSNTTGFGNTANGAFALFNNDVGNGNTAIGYDALNHNTGYVNTATGYEALFSNTTGVHNTANGALALFSNTGSDNTAVGHAALNHNSDGIQNTATGASALSNNLGGNFNTAMGYGALVANDTGGTNTAVGVGALQGNTSGSSNIALGYSAGANVTAGSFNVYIGTNVGGVADEVGHTYISNIASTQQNLSVVTVDLATGLLGHEFSSQRYKEDIKPMDNASEALYALKPVTYRYKKSIDKGQALDYGFIAEEVAKVDPTLVARDGKGQIESLRYNAINTMLLNEFLKEHRKIQDLQQGMAVLTAKLTEQAAQIQKVSAQVQMNHPTAKVVLNNP
jgi:trimeric autotransporter adhesin